MQKLVWQNANGVELDLTSGNYGITEWEGFSNASLNIQSQQVPFQDGGVFLDALIEQRELSVTLAMQDNNNLELRYQQRRELISALNPKLGEGYLIYTNDFISKRIKCVPQIPLFETHNSDTVGTPKASLSWTACSPYWEDIEETVVELPLGEEVTIENTGDVPVGIEVQIDTASITEPQLVNTTTGKLVRLTENYEGDILIDTKTGEKKVQTKKMKYNWSSGNNLKAMAEKTGVQVIVGGTAIWKSPNSVEIYSADGVLNMSFDEMIYLEKAGLFIGVGNVADTSTSRAIYIYTSKDGKAWKKVYQESESGVTGTSIGSITYSEWLGVLYVTWRNYLYTSTDGIVWTKTNVTFEASVRKIMAIGSRRLLMLMTTEKVLYSEDGTSWNNLLTIEADSMTYAEDMSTLVVSTGDGTFRTSNIIISSWTTYTGMASVKNIKYIKEKNKFYGNYNNIIYTSIDGVNWTESVTFQGVERLNSYFYSTEEKLLYVLGAGVICTQTENNTWNIVRASAYKVSVNSMNYISETEKYFVGVGSGINNNLMVSSDFKNWQIKQVESGTSSVGIFGVAYSPSLELYCVLTGTGVYSSTDLETFTLRSSISAVANFQHYGIIWVETLGMFVLTTASKIYTSTNGTSWTLAYEFTGGLGNIVWAEDKQMLVVVGRTTSPSRGYIIKSSDGVNWTSVELPTAPLILLTITYSKTLGLFCCVGHSTVTGLGAYSYLVTTTSSDLENWNVTKIAERQTPQSVIYSEKLKAFYLVGYGTQSGKGVLYTSRDGVNWSEKEVSHCYTQGHTTFSNCLADEKEKKIMIGGYDSLLIESFYSDYENVINTLSTDSNMNLSLEVGENKLTYTANYGGGTCTLRYKQKYIGV